MNITQLNKLFEASCFDNFCIVKSSYNPGDTATFYLKCSPRNPATIDSDYGDYLHIGGLFLTFKNVISMISILEHQLGYYGYYVPESEPVINGVLYKASSSLHIDYIKADMSKYSNFILGTWEYYYSFICSGDFTYDYKIIGY